MVCGALVALLVGVVILGFDSVLGRLDEIIRVMKDMKP